MPQAHKPGQTEPISAQRLGMPDGSLPGQLTCGEGVARSEPELLTPMRNKWALRDQLIDGRELAQLIRRAAWHAHYHGGPPGMSAPPCKPRFYWGRRLQ